MWSSALCGAETWTPGNVAQKHPESFEMKDGEDQFGRLCVK
jgi:hypothetical protein